MKTRRLMFQALLICSMMLLLASAAMAANTFTAAGTSITNQATVSYQDANSVAQTPVTSNVATVTVTQIYGVIVTPPTDAKSAANNANAIYTVTVTNNGNGLDTFDLSSADTSGWAPGTVTFSSTSDGATPITKTTSLAQNGSMIVYMVVPVPATAIDATTNVTTATATSEGTGNPSASDACTTTVIGADNLSTATKTDNNANPIVGSVPFTYTITIPNTGTKDAANVVVSDPIPAGLAYKAGSITLNSVGVADAATEGATTAYNSAGNGTVTINIGTLAHGATAVITFQASVKTGVTDGTAITNTANITFDTTGTDSPTDTVHAKGAALLGLTKTVNGSTSVSAAPGATLTYLMTAHNSGASNATNVVISDSVPANTTFVTGSIQVNGVTNAGDTDKSGNTISTPASTITPGGNLTLQFQATVN